LSISYIQRVCWVRRTARNRAMSSLVWINSIISVGRARSAAVLLSLVAAFGLGRIGDAQPPAGDSLARRVRVNVNGLRPSEFVYQTTLERDAGTTAIGTRTVSVAVTTYAGVPSWLLLETRTFDTGGAPAVDSLFADFAALRPMHWSAIQGTARLGVEFRGDTAFGATSGPPGRRSIVAVIPSGAM